MEQSFEVKLNLDDLKAKVEIHLEREIKKHIEDSKVDTFLRDNIASIFKTSWSDDRGSKLRKIIDMTIDDYIRGCVYDILHRTDIKASIEKAIESNLADGEFINSLAKAKTCEILTSRQNG